MKPEDTIDFHIRWAWLKIAKMYNRMGSGFGLSQSMGLVLLSIDPKEGTPSTSLGPMMGMESTSLSRTLKTMQDRGMIKRGKDVQDKRVMRIFLTKEGARLRSMASRTVVEFNEKILNQISPTKLKHFKEVIETIEQQTIKEA
ncbi:MAG: MarR family transcriptional regulator [Salibacteraceae bacterium]